MAQRTTYRQFCPVAMGADAIGSRWTLLIVRELLCGSRRFNEVHRGVPLMSRSLLSQRLQGLERIGLIERRSGAAGSEYRLTEAGEGLRPVVEMLGVWAHRYLQHDIPDDHLDVALLMWDVRRNVDTDAVPGAGRRVVEFRFAGETAAKRLWWLVVQEDDVDLCLKRPGYPVDLTVQATARDMASVWMERLPIRRALIEGRLKLEGSRQHRQAFPRWFRLSLLAPSRRGELSISRAP